MTVFLVVFYLVGCIFSYGSLNKFASEYPISHLSEHLIEDSIMGGLGAIISALLIIIASWVGVIFCIIDSGRPYFKWGRWK